MLRLGSLVDDETWEKELSGGAAGGLFCLMLRPLLPLLLPGRPLSPLLRMLEPAVPLRHGEPAL